ncbi:hypothetical protein PI126_g14879 [Phytophthora idaei]|nr:hypothetical protein PI126_g14879 [Phytophthora idaei]
MSWRSKSSSHCKIAWFGRRVWSSSAQSTEGRRASNEARTPAKSGTGVSTSGVGTTVEGDDAGGPATPSLGDPPAEARSTVDDSLGDLTEFVRTAALGADAERVDKSGASVSWARLDRKGGTRRCTYLKCARGRPRPEMQAWGDGKQ